MESGSGDVQAAGSSGVGDKPQDSDVNNDDDVDDDEDYEGKLRRHQFDKNIYTFSAAAGRALQQQTSDIKNLV